MSHKTRNIIIISVLILIVTILAVYFVIIQQPKKIKNVQRQITEMEQKYTNTDLLKFQLDSLNKVAERIDSLLFNRTKAIPFKESMTDTYNDIIRFSKYFSQSTKLDIEYNGTEVVGAASKDLFTLRGQGNFNDVYRLIYEIEKSKKLYKIKSVNLRNTTLTKSSGELEYQVYFEIRVESYFTKDKNLAINYEDIKDKKFRNISNYFYPLIRPEVPPNEDQLLELEGASLLALFQDGVFIIDRNGNSYTLSEGEPVYLGYLTKIDYDKQQCEFMLNKGGIIEKVTLTLKNINPREIKK